MMVRAFLVLLVLTEAKPATNDADASLAGMMAKLEKEAGGGAQDKLNADQAKDEKAINADQAKDEKARKSYQKAHEAVTNQQADTKQQADEAVTNQQAETKQEEHGDAKQAKQQEEKQQEEQARNLVNSDKEEVGQAVANLRNAAANFRDANRTQTRALAINLAEEARTQARDATKQKKEQARNDFGKSLSLLEHAAPTGHWKDNEKAARQKSEELDKLDHEEEKDARERLRSQRKSAEDKVRQSYRTAHQAAKHLLKDRNRLMHAQRRAGEKEHVYEKEEGMNERFAEHSQDEAEYHNDKARMAIEHVFEEAEDYLIERSRRYRDEATDKRHQAVQGAVKTLREEVMKDASKELFADSDSSSMLPLVTNLSLFAAALVGLMSLRHVYVNHSRIPRVQPVLG